MTSTLCDSRLAEELLAADSPRRPWRTIGGDQVPPGEVDVLADVAWPTMLNIESWLRDDAISPVAASRAIDRIGGLARQFRFRPLRPLQEGISALVTCGQAETSELAADIVGVWLESRQVQVRVCGGGVPRFEIVAELEQRPVDLVILASIAASEAPATRQLIDRIRTFPRAIRPAIIAGGGVFARAPELALEMGADVEMTSLRQLGQYLDDPTGRTHAQQSDPAVRHAA